MIATSDAVILLVSASLLATGVYRWQSSLDSFNLESVHGRDLVTSVVTSSPSNESTAYVEGDRPVIMKTEGGVLMGKPTVTGAAITAQSGQPGAAINENPNTGNTGGDATQLFGTHIVKSGDTLSALSDRYGTTVPDLQSINGIDGSLITVGQQLRYPLPLN
ncbi:MAG: LysM peptidoglycan-binding domain-containing protein [Granulosicoccus sp.]